MKKQIEKLQALQLKRIRELRGVSDGNYCVYSMFWRSKYAIDMF